MDEHRRGFLFGAAAYVIWGIFPLYWPLLEPAGSLEILAHRVVWSLVFVAVLLRFRPRPGWWARLRRRPATIGYLAAAALVIAVNWGTYIWAVNHDHVVETALGYYINPLVTVLVGVVVLAERLNRVQWIAVAVAALAVVVLTVDYGQPPWIALTLAVSFTVYALCKKKADAHAIEGFAVETAVIAPVALGYLCWLQVDGSAAFLHTGTVKSLLFVSAGIATAIPLLFFAAAAVRVSLTTLGILQYAAPTLQFLIGVFVFHEPMPPTRLLGFAIVWLALAIFTWDGLRRHRRRTTPAVPTPAVQTPAPRAVLDPDAT